MKVGSMLPLRVAGCAGCRGVTKSSIGKRFGRWLMLLGLLCLLGSADALAQQVSGTVRDAQTGDPLPGVNVVVKGTTLGTATDLEGRYSLTVPSLQDTLVFSFVGYETHEEPIAGRSVVEVGLAPAVIRGEEVVVIGYGTQRRVDLTGAVAIAEPDELKKLATPTIEGALQGQLAGVAVTSSGAPGETPEVRIRGITSFGNNDPLYIVDGVPVDRIIDLNVSDIESIQVLKDAAAAAIYGTRAANGVVIITTRRGQRGLRVEYDGSVGVANIYQRWDVMEREEYQALMNEMLANAGQPPAPGNDPNSPFYIDDIDTDWQEEALKPGLVTSHNLAISGGNEVSTYSVSAGYLRQEPTMVGKAPSFERLSVRVNSDHRRGRFSFGESVYLVHAKTMRQESRHEESLFENLIRAIPTMPVHDPNRKGGYGGTDANIERAISLNVIGVNNLLESPVDAYRGLLNLYGQLELLTGLTYKVNAAVDVTETEDYLFVPQYDLGFFFTEQNGTLDYFKRRWVYWLLEHTLTYDRTFGRHHLTLLAGATWEKGNYEHTGGHAQGYPTTQFKTLEAGTDPNKTVFHWKSANALQSILGRVNYNYADRYLFSATVRRDGSSRFGRNNRYGVFPSVSAGWRVSNEPFFNVSFVNDLKIRGSWGRLGNQNIDDYATVAVVNTYANYNFNDHLAPGAIQVTLVNPNLKWETTTSWDVGVDATLFDAHLQLTVDYYDKTTDGILIRVPIPLSVGSTENPLVNAASLKNWGWEFSATYRAQRGDLNYEVWGNLTTWNNKVLSLGYGGEPIYGAASITQEGGEVGAIYGWVTDGLFQSEDEICRDATGVTCREQGLAYQTPGTAPGDIRFKDLNGDGLITDDDRTVLGSAIPDFFYGLGVRMNYRQWDASIFAQGSYGNKIFNHPRRIVECGFQNDYGNAAETVKDHWTPDNRDAKIPRVIYLDPNGNCRDSDRWVEDGSYLRLQNLTLGYTLPRRLADRLGITNLRLYVSVDNLFTITGYSGWDPDLADDGDEVENDALFSRGYDGGGWPHPRIVRAGVQLSF